MADNNPFPSRRELRRRERLAQMAAEQGQTTEDITEETGPVPVEPVQPVQEPVEAPQPSTQRPAPQPAAAEPEQQSEEPEPQIRRTGSRRADAEITSTGQIPTIHVPVRPETATPRPEADSGQPMTRREARRLRQLQETGEQPVAEPAVEASDLTEVEDASQTAAFPSVTENASEQEINFSTSSIDFGDSSEITDVQFSDTVEIGRQELDKASQDLSEQITEFGDTNPQNVDPVLLARQQELARKAQELAELENTSTEAMQAVEDLQEPEVTDTPPPIPPSSDPFDPPAIEPLEGPATQPRRATAAAQQSVELPAKRDQEPLGAIDAHGLDPLQSSESAAWERKVLLLSGLFAAIGLLALVTALIIMFT